MSAKKKSEAGARGSATGPDSGKRAGPMSGKDKLERKAKGEPMTFTRPKQATRLQPKVKQARIRNKKGGG